MKKIAQSKMRCFYCLSELGEIHLTMPFETEPVKVMVFCAKCDPFRNSFVSGGASGADAVPGALGVDSIDVEFEQFLQETYEH